MSRRIITCIRCGKNKECFCKDMCKYCYKHLWKKTEKGQICEKRYATSKKGREISLKKTLKYQHSKRGKEIIRKYDRINTAEKRARKLQAYVICGNKEKIKCIYNNCPDGFSVDHIIPLKNKNVSGLHVEWNLQYLAYSQNSKKKNSFDSTYANNGWRQHE